MASTIYRNYLIVGSAQYYHASDEWSPVALIFPDALKMMALKNLAERFKTALAAEEYAVDAGRAWVDSQSVEKFRA